MSVRMLSVASQQMALKALLLNSPKPIKYLLNEAKIFKKHRKVKTQNTLWLSNTFCLLHRIHLLLFTLILTKHIYANALCVRLIHFNTGRKGRKIVYLSLCFK